MYYVIIRLTFILILKLLINICLNIIYSRRSMKHTHTIYLKVIKVIVLLHSGIVMYVNP